MQTLPLGRAYDIPMKNSSLCLHAGGSSVTLEQVADIKTPEPDGIWHPIPHLMVYQRVREAMESLGMSISEEQHALAKDGQRWFALLSIRNGKSAGEDYGYVLGLRNSHDRSFTAGLACGSRVFICDNLAFSAEIVIARKHTTFIERDLPILAGNAVGRLASKWTDMDKRFEAYRGHEVSNERAHDLTIRALDLGAITTTQIPHVLQEWRNPTHNEFRECGKTAWRYFNAVTQVSKGTSIFALPRRTQSLHGLLDSECGIGFDRGDITSGTVDATVTNN